MKKHREKPPADPGKALAYWSREVGKLQLKFHALQKRLQYATQERDKAAQQLRNDGE